MMASAAHDESLRVCMDRDLALRLAMNHRVKYIDESVFLAKGRRRGQCEEARRAIGAALALRPFAAQYRFYQLRWRCFAR